MLQALPVLLVVHTISALPSNWAIYPGLNAVPHCPNTCVSPPPFRCLGLFPGPTATACLEACAADPTCSQATWAQDDGRCFTRTDGQWELVGGGTVAACNNLTLPGCIPPPPANNTILRAVVAPRPSGVPMHPLAPGVTLDGWNGTLFPKWGNGSYLSLDLGSATLRAMAASLAPGLLRLGGSPEDSIDFTLDGGGCVAGSNGPLPPAPGGYYCSQVKPRQYGCLTGARWEALLAFAAAANLSLVLGVNGCYGRQGADSPMDFSNVRALLQATAASAHRRALLGLELTNEVFGNTITPRAWGADMDTLSQLVVEVLGAPVLLAGPDDASPTHLAQALNSTARGTLTALTYHHYPGCAANTTPYFALDPRCLQVIDEWGAQFSSAAGAPAGVATWAGETAAHGGGGVPGLTDSFTSTLYYAWQLGALPLSGVELSARQALVGGDYALLRQGGGGGSLSPNPDFWLLWLFKALVGGGAQAYAVNTSAPVAVTGVRAFAFGGGKAGAGRAVLALSLNTIGARLGLALEEGGEGGAAPLAGPRLEFHLQGQLGVGGGGVTCNGVPLAVGAGGALPDWRALGVRTEGGTPLMLEPGSVVLALLGPPAASG